MIVGRLVLKNLADVSVKRNISKNTLIDDKFFNWFEWSYNKGMQKNIYYKLKDF